METLTNPRGSSDPTAAAPGWVMLNRYYNIFKDSGSSAGDAKTTAAACTSTGQPFSVSFRIAAPPEACSLHYHLLGGEGTTPSRDDDKDQDDDKDLQLQIVAAHDDSVLMEARVPQHLRVFWDYFLYEAGAGRKPWLSLLPGCYISNQFQRNKDALQVPTRIAEARNLSLFHDTGILCRGDGEVLVAQLEVCWAGYDAPYSTAELCVLDAGAQDWVVKEVPIVHHEGEGVLVRDWTQIDAVVSIGSQFMCWVDYLSGFLLCDMAEENPKLRYVPFPVSPPDMRDHYGDRPNRNYRCNLAAAGPGAIRFVSVAPRCCCGGPGQTSCERSRFAFNVTTWTLNLKTEEPMVWVKDGVLDCDEIWQLPNYGRLPHVAPRHPIVSCDDPDIIWFTIREDHYFIDDADKTVWMFEINIRSKALLSVVCSDLKSYAAPHIVPAKLQW